MSIKVNQEVKLPRAHHRERTDRDLENAKFAAIAALDGVPNKLSPLEISILERFHDEFHDRKYSLEEFTSIIQVDYSQAIEAQNAKDAEAAAARYDAAKQEAHDAINGEVPRFAAEG